MSIIKFSNEGNFEKTKKFLEGAKDVRAIIRNIRITTIAEAGVSALKEATPVDTGLTANSWSYEIEEKEGKVIVHWFNTNVVKGISIATILQYGHMTRTGGYVEGRDYINPALRPIFDKMTDDMWKAGVSL